MATSAFALAPRANQSALYAKELKYEFLGLLRRRSFSLATIGFPVMFYLIFGVANRHDSMGTVSIAKYLLGGYACFGVVGSALFGIGVGLAMDRRAGWLDLKRASPMPPLAYLLAKCMTAMAFGVIIASILMILSVTLAGVHLSVLEIAKVLACTAAGAIPFAAMGMLLALVIPANATPGVVNLIYLPMSFCSGLWIPLRALPVWVQRIAPALPTYHLAQLMLGIFGYAETGAIWTHCVMLLGFTLVMLGGSWLVFQRAEQKA
jgi:ABC-2 type transport system permease protein